MAKGMKIDFGDVDKEIRRGGKAAHLPEGDYLFKVVKHEVRKTKDGTGRYINWQMQCVSKKYKGKTVYLNTSLKRDALWNLRNLIHACTSKNVAGKALEFDPTSLYGKIFGGTTEDNEYEGSDGKVRVSSQIVDIRPKEELEGEDEDDTDDDDGVEVEEEDTDEDEDEDDEKPAKAKDKKGKKGKKGKKKSDDTLDEVDVDKI